MDSQIFVDYLAKNQKEFNTFTKECKTDIEKYAITIELLFANQLISYEQRDIARISILAEMQPESKAFYISTVKKMHDELEEKYIKAYKCE